MAGKYFSLKGTTPAGELQYPKLQTPDTKFSPEGVYSTNIILNEDEHEAMLKTIAPAMREVEAELGQLPARKRDTISVREPFTPEYDDSDNETGRYIWKAKTKAEIKGVARKVSMFDATGKRLMNVNPWGGTTAVVAFTASPYVIPGSRMAGVSLRLEAVQILELVQGGSGGSASSFGFDAVAGYDAIEDAGDHEEAAVETAESFDDVPDF